MKQPWLLLLLFKIGWFGLVMVPNYAVVPVAILLLWQLTQLPGTDRIRWLALTVVGMALDASLITVGFLQTATQQPMPIWLALLWGWFIWAWLQVFSPWLQQRWQVLIFCSIGGPLAYRGGALLSDQLIYPQSMQFTLIHSMCWLGLGVLMLIWRQRNSNA
jgi:hypothetical protein